MKTETAVFGAFAGFLIPAGIVYWFLSHDTVGATCIIFSSGLATLIAFYLGMVARRIDLRPQDRPEAEIAENAGELGTFSPGSPWPVMIAAGVVPAAMGVAIGFWLTMIAALWIVACLVGLVVENTDRTPA